MEYKQIQDLYLKLLKVKKYKRLLKMAYTRNEIDSENFRKLEKEIESELDEIVAELLINMETIWISDIIPKKEEEKK